MANELITQIRNVIDSDGSQSKLMAFFGDDKEKVAKFKSALITIAQNGSLKSCSAGSIIKSAFNLAELGLEINPLLNQAYIVKYRNDAEPIISYKGWQSIVEKAGKRVKAFCVFKCDTFTMDLSDFDENITFIPNYDERQENDDQWFKANLKGVLVKIKDLSDGYVKNSFVSLSKIEKIKGMSPSAKSAYSPYNSWSEEMYLAKAIKYVLSREALNFELIGKAINADNQLDIKLQNDNRGEAKKDELETMIDAEAVVND